MRVLYIPSGDDKYGAPKSMMELVGNLSERHNIEPIIMTCKKGLINEWSDKHGFENYVLGQGSFMVVGGSNWFRKTVKHGMYPYLKYKYEMEDMYARQRIEKLIGNKRIDLIHTNVNRVDIGGYYSLGHEVPHVWHLREFGKEDYNCMFLRRDAVDFMNKSSTMFVAISNAVKQAWIDKGLEEKKIKVIYNGIDLSNYPKEIPERVNTQLGPLKIVFAGIISETKGQYQLIKAIDALPDHIKKQVKVDFYGGGREEYINKLQNIVKRLKLESLITFKGYSSRLFEILPQYDIGIVASRAEAFGRVTIEYMASGLCVIASNSGANPEIVHDAENGLLYKFNDYQELADKIRYLAANRDVLFRIRKYAYESVSSRYSMNRCADDVYDLYREIARTADLK